MSHYTIFYEILAWEDIDQYLQNAIYPEKAVRHIEKIMEQIKLLQSFPCLRAKPLAIRGPFTYYKKWIYPFWIYYSINVQKWEITVLEFFHYSKDHARKFF